MGIIDAGALDAGKRGDPLIRTEVPLHLPDGDVERQQRVLAGLGQLLAVAGHLGLHPREGGQAQQKQHEEGHEDYGDEQGEAAWRLPGHGFGGHCGAAVGERLS